ncbi:hypothetical protein [Parafrankia elaeagni]|uniref:hypothetical protein n=1 Tax=Parafrankia elaeagni TaxID=222534 RepID=UPI0012B5A65B|nr:hypothetical protein [Parafrankia elaeagni]
MSTDSTERIIKAILSVLPETDHQLEFITDIFADGTSFNFPLPLGMLVHGSRIRGNLIPTIEWAKGLDGTIMDVVGAATFVVNGEELGGSADLRRVFQEAFAGLFERIVTESKETRKSVGEALESLDESVKNRRGGVDLDKIPSDLVDDYLDYHSSRETLALANAELWNNESGWTLIGFMRVQTRSISAWWIEGRPR